MVLHNLRTMLWYDITHTFPYERTIYITNHIIVLYLVPHSQVT